MHHPMTRKKKFQCPIPFWSEALLVAPMDGGTDEEEHVCSLRVMLGDWQGGKRRGEAWKQQQ
jgi:hypothetical protein